MAIKKKKPERGEELFREHRALEELLWSVVRCAGVEPRRPGVALSLTRDLRRLRGLLERHFEREESGGLFDEILARLPFMATELDALREEHPCFLERVDGLIYRLETPPADLRAIHQDLSRFAKTFLAHEQLENVLLQRAFYRDLGGSD